MYRIALNVAISYYRRAQQTGVRLSLSGDLQLMDLENLPDGSAEVEERPYRERMEGGTREGRERDEGGTNER